MREYKGYSLMDFPSSYVVIDIETTGLDPSRDKIIEIGAIKVVDGVEMDAFSSLINPDVAIDDFITNLTGITNEMLCNAPGLKSVLCDFSDFIEDSILVGHNINFDVNFLYDNFERCLSRPLTNNFVDTLRLSKWLFKSLSSYKLGFLAKYFDIPIDGAHRSLADCRITKQVYEKIVENSDLISSEEQKVLNSLSVDESNPFYGKRIAVKGIPQLYSYNFMKEAAQKCGAKLSNIFYSSCDYVVFSRFTYNAYKRGDTSEKFIKANQLVENGKLTILSEKEWCELLSIPVPKNAATLSGVRSKDISTENTEFDETHPLYGKLCVFTGTLEQMKRKEAMQRVVDLGGSVADSVSKKTNYLILGNNDYCPLIKDPDKKSSKQKKAEKLKLAGNDIEIISENVFYDMLVE
mgnify:CR=1 FL=1